MIADMTRPENPWILLFNPPLASPAGPPAALPQLAAWLATAGAVVEPCDANLDFFLKRLFTPQFVRKLTARVAQRLARGGYAGQDPKTLALMQEAVGEKGRFAGDLSWLEHLAPALRDQERFFNPAAFAAASEDLESLLMLASLAWSPAVAGLDGLEFPPGEDGAALRDLGREFFDDLWRETLALKLERQGLALAALVATEPGRLAGAICLADFLRREKPGLPLALLRGGEDAPEPPAGLFDRVIRLDRLGSPAELTRALLPGLAEPSGPPGPHLGGLEVMDYLSPGPVLPLYFSAGLGLAARDICEPGKAAELCLELAGRYQAGGLVLPDIFPWPWLRQLASALPPAGQLPPLAISLALAEPQAPQDLAELARDGVACLRWLPGTGDWGPRRASTAAANLAAANKAGLFNHLVLGQNPPGELLDFCLENPNLAHSLEPLTQAGPSPRPGPPDEPLWRRLGCLAWLLPYLGRLGARRLKLARLAPEDHATWLLGEELTFHYARPEQAGPAIIDQMEALVLSGGAVGGSFLRGNLEKAHLLGWVLEKGVMVAAAALKNPRPEFIERLRRKTGLDLSGYLERGYLAVLPEYRGQAIATRLAGGLTSRKGERPLYVVEELSNLAVRQVTERNGARLAASYYSELKEAELGLFIYDPQNQAGPEQGTKN